MITNLSIIVLTYNEEIHIARLLDNLLKLTSKIYVVDSYSTDATISILESNNILYSQNKFINHSKQINYAIETNPFETTWTLRIDADELISDKLISELAHTLNIYSNSNVNGFYLQRKVVFMSRQLHYGNLNPMWLLRVWRTGEGFCNEKWMDEKIVLKHPNTKQLKEIFFDHNLNSLTWWTNKHNLYSNREAIEILKEKYLKNQSIKEKASNRDLLLFKLKSIYNMFPMFIRPILLFLYSFILRLGFLDGKQGVIWNVLQVFWYRYLVDCKVFEIERVHNFDSQKIVDYLMQLDE
ncbi:glycosyltransferase family 2 protein [Aquirufa sp. OSTEICH-129V]|uniref:Glycosyltransferase family 2 protein n=1 Tax=Aquirufa avitistagni TaxID=3104728 RepID=A0ABW6DFU8_9BACT